MKPFCFVFLSICLMSSYAQQSNQEMKNLHFIFRNTVSDSVLQTEVTYQNYFGEPFKVRSFKYYISHIEIRYNNEKFYFVKMAPHLVNEADSNSKKISFSAPAGNITGVRFLLGIDSATNTNGVQTGDLDPSKGMFWIWNTGYIMAKLEGFSSISKAPGKQYSFDVGGYKDGENTARQINLSLPSITSNQSSTFIITADIGKWFYGKNNIKIAEQPMCHSPGALAMKIAGNYADMFSIQAK